MRHDDQRSGRAGVMLIMLSMAAAISAANVDFRLVEAARSQDHSAVRKLLDEHVDVNARSNDGSTALLWATHWNDVETATQLIRAGADANLSNDFRMTPLSVACTNGSAPFVE